MKLVKKEPSKKTGASNRKKGLIMSLGVLSESIPVKTKKRESAQATGLTAKFSLAVKKYVVKKYLETDENLEKKYTMKEIARMVKNKFNVEVKEKSITKMVWRYDLAAKFVKLRNFAVGEGEKALMVYQREANTLLKQFVGSLRYVPMLDEMEILSTVAEKAGKMMLSSMASLIHINHLTYKELLRKEGDDYKLKFTDRLSAHQMYLDTLDRINKLVTTAHKPVDDDCIITTNNVQYTQKPVDSGRKGENITYGEALEILSDDMPMTVKLEGPDDSSGNGSGGE